MLYLEMLSCFAYSAAAFNKKKKKSTPYHLAVLLCVIHFIKAFDVDFVLPTTGFG